MPTLTTYAIAITGKYITKITQIPVKASPSTFLGFNVHDYISNASYAAPTTTQAWSSSSMAMLCMANEKTGHMFPMCAADIHMVERQVRANGNRSLPPPCTGRTTSLNLDSRPQNPLIGKQCLPVQNRSNNSRSAWDMSAIIQKKASSTSATLVRLSTSVHSRHLVGDIGLCAPEPPLKGVIN